MNNYIISQFGKPSGFVGKLVGLVMSIKNKERNEWAVEKILPGSEERILEIGYGSGTAIKLMMETYAPKFIAGIDHSDEMRKYANGTNAKQVKQGKVELQTASVNGIPYHDNYFDKVYGVNVSLFFPDPVKNFKEIKRVLKRGGKVYMFLQPRTKESDKIEMIMEKLAQQVRDAGFDKVTTEVKEMNVFDTICVEGENKAG